MASTTRLWWCVIGAACLLGCKNDAPASDGGTGSSSGGGGSTTVTSADSSSGGTCEMSQDVHEPATLKSDVVISVATSLLIDANPPTPHPTLKSAFGDVVDTYTQQDVRVAMITDTGYDPIVGDDSCQSCIDPTACADPVDVMVDTTGITPVGNLASDYSKYACMFRPPGEAIKHFVAFTDTEPSPTEMMGLQDFMNMQILAGDSAFHVAYMLGCSQMEGGMGLEPFATATGGTSGNICDGVAGVRTFLEDLVAPRVECTWPIDTPANNSTDNLDLTLLDAPSGGEMMMTKVADPSGCTMDEANPAFEWFVSDAGGGDAPIVRLCPGTCNVIQANWKPGEVSFRQTFSCP